MIWSSTPIHFEPIPRTADPRHHSMQFVIATHLDHPAIPQLPINYPFPEYVGTAGLFQLVALPAQFAPRARRRLVAEVVAIWCEQGTAAPAMGPRHFSELTCGDVHIVPHGQGQAPGQDPDPYSCPASAQGSNLLSGDQGQGQRMHRHQYSRQKKSGVSDILC